ncbi:hypothetical protein BD413DRAFT_629036 [Trametes elegans]|nr:hypothetical protein BD413DRAFT_629036 [Trametes elegans]
MSGKNSPKCATEEPPDLPRRERGDLTQAERWWPGWEPSWRKSESRYKWTDTEDRIPAMRPTVVLDAVRTSDASLVMLKKVFNCTHPQEISLTQYLASEEMRDDPRNHTVPVWDVFAVPDEPGLTILVMPLLRSCDDPPFQTVGEVVAFLTQVFEVRIPRLLTTEYHVRPSSDVP